MNIEQKKRGRRPKVVVDQVVEKPQEKVSRRGRKPKAVYNGYLENSIQCSSDDEHIIMKLNIGSKDTNEDAILFDYPNAYNDIIVQNGLKFSEYDDIPLPKEDVVLLQDNSPAPTTLKVVNLLKDFEEKNKNNEWPTTTNIYCYWCCHKFDNPPFGIPVKYVDKLFHVYGCFCSLECASAYNFDSKEHYDEIWERYNLINLLAKLVGYDETVKLAPTRLALIVFGGYLSIEAFREYCKSGKKININFPPMMTLTQQLEEINEIQAKDFRYVPVDNDRISKYKEKISLRRNKPINALENTLDHTMNLKFGS